MYRDKRQAVELMRLVVDFAAFFLLMTGGVPYRKLFMGVYRETKDKE
ncbi:hypothetical protein [Aneurinibacillus migulanus]|uniref:Uncharacterized protein n=1 Tax=Aneurinibacillus migulanus TaxID=47500 RepID=A0A1G8GK53_ANEMI|nr:hypothetical protein [Aneurinibacillus migulanus]MED0891051.1 hypothetical protein [Aneurinibacillus migulanus]MED1614261.1 hypothetical protein [Aneurinibacillus migulanus]GED17672.1 hypothetical protein AMI01nite_56630 [Aneurinibacillus migulanus]SDH94795.1 hypothetical protein SAMN04487909_1018 [Aneurinibacillus migulanus]